MFESSVVPAESLVGMVLPLFKGKGLKASEKDNYRGRTLFLSYLKCSKWSSLRRFLKSLEKFAKDKTISLISSSVLKTELGVLRPRFS